MIPVRINSWVFSVRSWPQLLIVPTSTPVSLLVIQGDLLRGESNKKTRRSLPREE